MIPIAIEAGMPLDEFWYGEEELFCSYVKAYRNRVNYTSWMNNLYAKPIDFEAEAEKQKPVTKEDLESEFRRRMSVF